MHQEKIRNVNAKRCHHSGTLINCAVLLGAYVPSLSRRPRFPPTELCRRQEMNAGRRTQPRLCDHQMIVISRPVSSDAWRDYGISLPHIGTSPVASLTKARYLNNGNCLWWLPTRSFVRLLLTFSSGFINHPDGGRYSEVDGLCWTSLQDPPSPTVILRQG